MICDLGHDSAILRLKIPASPEIIHVIHAKAQHRKSEYP